MTENMVTNSSRVLHLIALVTGESLTQLSNSNLQILGSKLTSQLRLRCPFLNHSIKDRESESLHNNANCVDSKGRGDLQITGADAHQAVS